MATVEIIRHKVSGQAAGGGAAPIADGRIIAQQTITLTGAAQKASDVVAGFVAGANEAWTLVVSGGPARVLFGDAAASLAPGAGVGWPLSDGTNKPFSVSKGDTVAVING